MKSRNVVNCRSCGSIRNSSLGLCYLYLSLLLLFKTAIANAVCALRQELLAYSHIPFCHHSPFSSVKNLPTAIHFFGSFGSVVGVYAFSLYSLFSMDFNIHFFLRTYFLKLLLPSVHNFLALGWGVSVFFFLNIAYFVRLKICFGRPVSACLGYVWAYPYSHILWHHCRHTCGQHY